MDTNDWIDSMGLTFFCNRMVEELYYLGKNQSVSAQLEENCKKGIAEFNSLKWPREKPYPDIKTNLFNTNYNLEIFEKICKHYKKSAEQMIDELIGDLENIISDNPINEKYQTAQKLQDFFDYFGDCGYYATRDCLRSADCSRIVDYLRIA